VRNLCRRGRGEKWRWPCVGLWRQESPEAEPWRPFCRSQREQILFRFGKENTTICGFLFGVDTTDSFSQRLFRIEWHSTVADNQIGKKRLGQLFRSRCSRWFKAHSENPVRRLNWSSSLPLF
jgi:hypothetical protein